MRAATGRSLQAELARARRHQAIARDVKHILGAACALLILGVWMTITIEVLDASVGTSAPVSVSDRE